MIIGKKRIINIRIGESEIGKIMLGNKTVFGYREELDYISYGNGTCRVAGIGTVRTLDIAIPSVSPNDDTVIAISANAFATSKITSVVIPDTVTSIGTESFRACNDLAGSIILNGIVNINDMAFYHCVKITSVDIGSNITSIGTGAFNSCRGLTRITVRATTPPTLQTQVFDYTNNCPIYVPAASVAAYKAATNWSALRTRIFAIQE